MNIIKVDCQVSWYKYVAFLCLDDRGLHQNASAVQRLAGSVSWILQAAIERNLMVSADKVLRKKNMSNSLFPSSGMVTMDVLN